MSENKKNFLEHLFWEEAAKIRADLQDAERKVYESKQKLSSWESEVERLKNLLAGYDELINEDKS